MDYKNRAERVLELEEIFGKRVFLIIYSGEIEIGDEKNFRYHFIEELLIKEDIEDCVIILEGMGGNLKTSILCSELLRKNLKRYSIFVPTIASSSLCYFILQSNELLIGRDSLITQLEAIFDYGDQKDIRAIKSLNHPDPRIKEIAIKSNNYIFEKISEKIKNPPHVFKEGVAKKSQKKNYYLSRCADSWMCKPTHESPLTWKDLFKLDINFNKVGDETIEKTKKLIWECHKELIAENCRIVIQTSKVEEGLFGGFFYS